MALHQALMSLTVLWRGHKDHFPLCVSMRYRQEEIKTRRERR